MALTEDNKRSKMAPEVGPPILQTLSSNPEYFLQPTSELHADVLASAKHFLDPVASGISHAQQAKGKRKRGDSTSGGASQPLRLQEIHVNGFTPQLVWEQAQRVLKSCSSVTANDAAVAKTAAAANAKAVDKTTGTPSSGSEEDQVTDEGSDAGMQDEELDELEDGVHEDDLSVASSDIRSSVNNKDEEEIEEGEDEDEDGDEGVPGDNAQTALRPDRFGLNDGFFSIDEFNKQTAFFEHRDNKKDADGNEEDEEAVDWNEDPFRVLGLEEEDEELNGDVGEDIGDDDDDDEDLDALDDGSYEMPIDDETGDPRDIRYDEFFDPPELSAPQKQKASKLGDKPKLRQAEDGADDDEVGRAMSDVRRDLFDHESDDEDDGSDDAYGNADAVNLKGLSTHEQRRVKLADEIRKLETSNVAKKDWTVSGEARGADRPQNALLEEHLEFEHAGKPVPVITAEMTDDIEAQIKQRIIAKEFDEVVRRNPLAVAEQQRGSKKSGKFELDDSKPQQSLAETYEADHMRATDPGYVDVKDAKLKKEHDEIRQLWNNVSSQLDTLSNWHYKPKTPGLNINVVQDVDTIKMEDVRPSGAGGATTSAMLAPQEIYAPGDDGKNRGEVLPQSGTAVAKDEMSREAKSRRRKREKQKLKKAGRPAPKPEGAAAQKQQVVSDLKKGSVKVIGKGGRLNDVEGREAGGLSTVKDKPSTLKL